METLRNKIEEAKGLPAASLKIVYKGKTVTNNENTIEELGIKETDFLVVMSQVAVNMNEFRSQSNPRKRKSRKNRRKSRIQRM